MFSMLFPEMTRFDLLDEVHTDCASEHTVRKSVCNVAPVVWQTSFDIVVHTATWS